MASIVQRNKSFSVVYTVYDGDKKKQKWESYHSYEEALRRKEQLEIIQQQEKERLKYHSGTLAQFLEEYVELYGRIHWACSTYSSNTALIRNYIVPFMGTMQIHEFSPKVIAVLYGKLQKEPKVTPQLMTQIHKLLHSAFEQAVLWEYLERNPFRKATILKPFPNEIVMLAPDQMKTLLQNCTEPMLTVALHLTFAGSLRKGEILALTWDDIDFDKGTVSVSKSLKRVRRDAVEVLNEKDILYQFSAVFDEGRTVTVLKRPKTRSSVRTVYLPTFVMGILTDWKSKQTPCGKGKLDLVLRYGNGRPIQEETLPRMLEKELLALGLPRVTFHVFRHTFCTNMANAGMDLKSLQYLMGHSDVSVTLNVYTHNSYEKAEESMAKIVSFGGEMPKEKMRCLG